MIATTIRITPDPKGLTLNIASEFAAAID